MQNTNEISSSWISANRPLTIEELRDYISSELEGNPPLWITRRPVKYGTDVYINNAMILLEQSNFQSKLKVNGDTMTQVSISVLLSRGYLLCICKILILNTRLFLFNGIQKEFCVRWKKKKRISKKINKNMIHKIRI